MTDNRTTELLPCPFCGGEARIIEEAKNWWKPNCMNRECPSDWTHCYPTREEAIAAWNTRAEHGTLTAEQVMAIAGKHQSDYCSDTHVCFDWQAIADELNAELGSGTCELVETDSYRNANEVIHVLECSECGKTCEHVNGSYPRCPHCGARVKGGE